MEAQSSVMLAGGVGRWKVVPGKSEELQPTGCIYV